MLLSIEDAYYEDQMEFLIDNMLLQVHMLGEGILGQAVFTGKHRWMFSDTDGTLCAIENQDLFQDDTGIHRQFSSGIKTIAIIPVEPRGVLQFGSPYKILESIDFLEETRRLFREMQTIDTSIMATSSLKSEVYDPSGLISSISSPRNSHGYSNCNSAHMSAELPSSSTYLNQSHLTNKIQFQTGHKAEAQVISSKPTISTWSSEASTMTSLSSEKGIQGSSSIFTNPNHLLSQPYSFDDLLSHWLEPSQDQIFNTSMASPALNESNFLQDSITNMLNSAEVFQPDSLKHKEGGGDFLGDIIWPTATCISDSAPSKKGLFSELGIRKILDEISCNTNSTTKSTTSVCSNKVQLPDSSCFSGTMMEKKRNFEPQKEVMVKSQVGLWIDDSYSINGGNAVVAQPKRLEEPVKPAKKRARPGESTRPRPKDRQQIQDRVKELREIIPNGAKCSIDALLDQTIKHMIFLQGVMKYADKLKHVDEPKLIGHGNGVVLKDSSGGGGSGCGGGGATWAFEVGGQARVCPIIVEDLSPPGQMLIEMLCEERGLFLEIADIIRSFGLVILKGQMEFRENKIWTHFIVEADKNVTRMEVFLALVQLLQQTSSSGIGSGNQSSKNQTCGGGILLFDNYEKPQVHLPAGLAETIHCSTA